MLPAAAISLRVLDVGGMLGCHLSIVVPLPKYDKKGEVILLLRNFFVLKGLWWMDGWKLVALIVDGGGERERERERGRERERERERKRERERERGMSV